MQVFLCLYLALSDQSVIPFQLKVQKTGGFYICWCIEMYLPLLGCEPAKMAARILSLEFECQQSYQVLTAKSHSS
jgi:hypothetical protein